MVDAGAALRRGRLRPPGLPRARPRPAGVPRASSGATWCRCCGRSEATDRARVARRRSTIGLVGLSLNLAWLGSHAMFRFLRSTGEISPSLSRARSSPRCRAGPRGARGCSARARPAGASHSRRRSCHPSGGRLARRSTSLARWKRLIRLSTTMSNGVVVVPCSLKPRTWKRPGLRPAVDELVHGARVAVEGEDHVPVGGEEVVELAVGVAVRVVVLGQQGHQVDDVDEADLQVGHVLAEQLGGRQRLLRRHVTRAGEDDVGRLPAGARARPLPDPAHRPRSAGGPPRG